MDEITVEAWQASFRGSVPDDVVEGQHTGPRGDFFRSHLPSGPPSHTAVATEGGTVIGYVHVGPSRDEDGKGLLEVWGLYVSPRHHRRGVGRTLMQHAIQWIESAGHSEMTLWTLSDVASARRFYEAMGGQWDLANKSESVRGHDLALVRYRFRLSELP